MINKTFINRQGDIEMLNSLWNKEKGEFLVLYGRRRVGKTALIAEFARKKKILHWIAYRTTSSELLRDLSRQLYSYLNNCDLPAEDFSYGSWRTAFETMADFAQNKKIGVIIDEFPYIVESDPSIPSLLQAVWDSKLSHSNIFFGLSGSCIGMMKSEILESRAPLFGRATSTVYLQPISVLNTMHFFPKYSLVQLVETYGVTGGVPKYFEFFSDKQPVLKNIENAIENNTTLLTAEADLLLNEEFRETRTYISILRALGKGALEIKKMSEICGVDSKALSKYLDQLIELKFVRRKVPAGLDAAHSRKSLYSLSDLFTGFYFRFIAPHLQNIEKGLVNDAIDDLRNNFDAYIGKNVFEEICRDWVSSQADKGKLSFKPKDVGEYWDKERQIDVLGLNQHDQMMLVGEAKWSNRKVGMQELQELEEKAKKLSKQNNYYYQLALFSRAGFAPQLTELAGKRNILLVSLQDIFGE